MGKKGYANKLMFGAMWSGRNYRNEGSIELDTIPLISPLRGGEEELLKVSQEVQSFQ